MYKNCVNLFARTKSQSRQSAIEMKQTHYFKDKISLTFSLTGQYLSKSLQIVVNTIIQNVAPCKQELSIFENFRNL